MTDSLHSTIKKLLISRNLYFSYITLAVLAGILGCKPNKTSQIETFESCVGNEIALCLDKSVTLLDSLFMAHYQTDSTSIDSLYLVLTNELIDQTIDLNRFTRGIKTVSNYHKIAQKKGLTNELFAKFKTVDYQKGFAPEDSSG